MRGSLATRPRWTSGSRTTKPPWRAGRVGHPADLKRRIPERFQPIRAAAEDFLKRHIPTIKLLRLDGALKAWANTLALAHDEIEREGAYLHLARLKLQVDRFAEVRAHLNAVTNEMYATLKKRLSVNLDKAEGKSKESNAPPADSNKKP